MLYYRTGVMHPLKIDPLFNHAKTRYIFDTSFSFHLVKIVLSENEARERIDVQIQLSLN